MKNSKIEIGYKGLKTIKLMNYKFIINEIENITINGNVLDINGLKFQFKNENLCKEVYDMIENERQLIKDKIFELENFISFVKEFAKRDEFSINIEKFVYGNDNLKGLVYYTINGINFIVDMNFLTISTYEAETKNQIYFNDTQEVVAYLIRMQTPQREEPKQEISEIQKSTNYNKMDIKTQIEKGRAWDSIFMNTESEIMHLKLLNVMNGIYGKFHNLTWEEYKEHAIKNNWYFSDNEIHLFNQILPYTLSWEKCEEFRQTEKHERKKVEEENQRKRIFEKFKKFESLLNFELKKGEDYKKIGNIAFGIEKRTNEVDGDIVEYDIKVIYSTLKSPYNVASIYLKNGVFYAYANPKFKDIEDIFYKELENLLNSQS